MINSDIPVKASPSSSFTPALLLVAPPPSLLTILLPIRRPQRRPRTHSLGVRRPRRHRQVPFVRSRRGKLCIVDHSQELIAFEQLIVIREQQPVYSVQPRGAGAVEVFYLLP